MGRKQKAEPRAARCAIDEHTWITVTGGMGYEPGYDTRVCRWCDFFMSGRIERAREETHPNTMIGKR